MMAMLRMSSRVVLLLEEPAVGASSVAAAEVVKNDLLACETGFVAFVNNPLCANPGKEKGIVGDEVSIGIHMLRGRERSCR